MSVPTPISQAILDTILGHLALLFLTAAGSDLAIARDAASQMLAAYNARTPDELSLAAEIISFDLHALEALAQAAAPDLSLNRTLRLRGSAVSLSREAHKARRKLDQLQRNRQTGDPQQPVATQSQPAAASPRIDTAMAVVEADRHAKKIVSQDGGQTWSQSLQKRLATQRMVEKIRKNAEKQARQAVLANAAGTQAAEAALSGQPTLG